MMIQHKCPHITRMNYSSYAPGLVPVSAPVSREYSSLPEMLEQNRDLSEHDENRKSCPSGGVAVTVA